MTPRGAKYELIPAGRISIVFFFNIYDIVCCNYTWNVNTDKILFIIYSIVYPIKTYFNFDKEMYEQTGLFSFNCLMK